MISLGTKFFWPNFTGKVQKEEEELRKKKKEKRGEKKKIGQRQLALSFHRKKHLTKTLSRN